MMDGKPLTNNFLVYSTGDVFRQQTTFNQWTSASCTKVLRRRFPREEYFFGCRSNIRVLDVGFYQKFYRVYVQKGLQFTYHRHSTERLFVF